MSSWRYLIQFGNVQDTFTICGPGSVALVMADDFLRREKAVLGSVALVMADDFLRREKAVLVFL
jgi:hypothetical protein